MVAKPCRLFLERQASDLVRGHIEDKLLEDLDRGLFPNEFREGLVDGFLPQRYAYLQVQVVLDVVVKGDLLILAGHNHLAFLVFLGTLVDLLRQTRCEVLMNLGPEVLT